MLLYSGAKMIMQIGATKMPPCRRTLDHGSERKKYCFVLLLTNKENKCLYLHFWTNGNGYRRGWFISISLQFAVRCICPISPECLSVAVLGFQESQRFAHLLFYLSLNWEFVNPPGGEVCGLQRLVQFTDLIFEEMHEFPLQKLLWKWT